MLQSDSFYMRMSRREKLMLERVAQHFERTQADTLKTFVRETYKLMQQQKAKEHQPNTTAAPAS
jgi:hypothetical protein